ncbi:cell division protein ZipA C-terminal FtsZ-binding domain-containing protein [Pseudorhodoferax sp. Leaf267]|uniref:cell division protein ZipA C-terminal FtsZ-binding domain-containing protein n=1 Tax=Pseudorhodoferax sp. Leaf267 TaxID=1736316 RepID=UPI0006F838CE|nr:cell division protein ZipA C-terminal FtsZ-binding domain-containing protein [Pseudorhodoferax sp. Leaf267]KQP14949.1 cell division protein FtsZ [Pseudorhodoferax sp. Leaf267]
MSSTLQIGLAVAGGVVLAAIVAHSAWSSRRNAPRRPDPEPADSVAPALAPALDGERREPGFDDALGALPMPLPADRRSGLDPLIDVIAPIAIDTPVSGDAALAATPSTRRVGSKPFALEGRNSTTQVWETPVAGQRYDALQAGVQLANRTGALNEIEFSEFVMKAQGFADAMNGAPEFPDMREEVARARELDQFASSHDAQLSFTLRAVNAAWSPGYLHQNAARLGFVAGLIPGRMVLPSATPGMPPILGLSFDAQAALAEDPDQSALRSVTLTLDVPQVERAEQPFVRMREAAAALAQAMDGVVTDDAARPLAREAMDVIGSELEQLYDTLDARDLSAGSALARRLFS